MKRLLLTLLFVAFVAHAFVPGDSVEDIDSDEAPLTLSDVFDERVDDGEGGLDLAKKKKPKKCKTNADCKAPRVCRTIKILKKTIKVCGLKPTPCSPTGAPPCSSRCPCALGRGPCKGHSSCKSGLRCLGYGKPGTFRPRICRLKLSGQSGPPSSDAGPPPASEAGPPPSSEAGPPPSSEAGPPPSSEAGPPPSSEAGPPPSSEAGPPPSSEAGPPPAGEAGPPPAGETDEDLVIGSILKSNCKNDDDCTAPKKCKELQLGSKKVKRCVTPSLTPPKKCSSDADCTSPKVCREVGLGPTKLKICVPPSPKPDHKCTTHADCPKPKVCKELTIMGKKIRSCVNPPKPAPKKCNSNSDCDPPKTTCRQVSKGILKLKLCLPSPPKPVTPQKCSSDSDCKKPRVCKEISFMGKKVKACVMKPKPPSTGLKKCKKNSDCAGSKVCKKVRVGFKKIKICVTCTGKKCSPPPAATSAPVLDDLSPVDEDSFADSSSSDVMDLKKKKPKAKKCKKNSDCRKPFICRQIVYKGKKFSICLPPVKPKCPPMKGSRYGRPCTPMCRCGPGQGPCAASLMCAPGLQCVEKRCKKPVPMTKPAPPKNGDESSDELVQDAGLMARCNSNSDCSGNRKCRKIPLIGRRCVGFPGRLAAATELSDDVNFVDEFEI